MMDEERYPVFFSEWLKLRRKALDLTQDELANRVGCSVGAVRKIESGDRRPSKQLAALLAQALEIPLEDQPIFIRVARNELHLERLPQTESEHLNLASDLQALRHLQQDTLQGVQQQGHVPSNRIPLETMPLIGRVNELAAVKRLFNEPQCRLLTLTGVGGIGKTSLAIEYAASNPSAFPGGIFYVPLTSVSSPDKIVPAVADVLNFSFSGPTELKEQLFNYLSNHIGQEALFIFDNLEHLLNQISTGDEKSGVTELVCEFLQRLTNVKILVTSRERLNLHGEWTYELRGLSVPPTSFSGQLEEYKSVELFVNRARRINSDFQITSDDQSSLIQICQLVEGVPLAIELAAAWVGMLSCREIAQEIQTNMDFLTTSRRDVPERHRSIRATFDHSWKLLTEDERNALCQLSVFQGGFDRNAAFQIAGASLPLLASLNAKSLLRRTASGRYDLHEVIRQYALYYLNEHPSNLETYERHCKYYLKFVGDREKSLKSAPQQETVRQLTDEIDNIRAAWAWAISHEKFTQLGQAGRGFGWYFEIAGLLREGIEQFDLLLQALKSKPQDNQMSRVMGLALIHQALLYFRKGEFDHARKLYEEGIIILRPLGDQTLMADALIYSGIILHLSGEYLLAKSRMDEGLVLARKASDRWFEAYAIYNLGYIASLLGSNSEGYEQMLIGLSMWRDIGDPFSIALGLNFLVPTLIKLRRYEEAKSHMQESIALCEQSKNRWGMGTAYRYLGLATMAAGQFTQAEIYFRKSLEIFGDSTIGWDISRSLAYLGDAATSAGEFSEARKVYRDALRISIEAKAIPISLDALSGLGNLLIKAGHTEQALMLCYFILNHPSSEDETKARVEQMCINLEPTFDPRQLNAAREKAMETTLEDIVELVEG